jgi:lambda repressor-like predicted transcriptional regulator
MMQCRLHSPAFMSRTDPCPVHTKPKLATVDPAPLCAAYEKGQSLASLSGATGLAVSAVYCLLRKAGTAMRPRGRRQAISESTLGLRAAYERGQTLQQLAHEHGVSHQAIRARLIRAGTVMRPRGARPKARQGRRGR